MSSPKPLLTVRSLKEASPGKTSKMGARPKSLDAMEYEVLEVSGLPVGYLTGEAPAKTIARLAELHRLLVEVGGYHHLKARFDAGYLDIPVGMLKNLEKLMAP